MMWLIIEINTITFIRLFFLRKSKSENIILYFIVQRVASFIILISAILAENQRPRFSIRIVALTGLLIKLGVAPLHTWVIPVTVITKKSLLFALLVVQKIIPFMWIIKINILIVSFIPAIAILNIIRIRPQNLLQNSFKLILGLSSMSHSSWLIIRRISIYLWEVYFIIYGRIIALILRFAKERIKTFSGKKNLIVLVILFIILGGIPPFMGFFPKFLIMIEISKWKIIVFATTILLLSLIDLFVYSRARILITFLAKNKIKWINARIIPRLIILINLLIIRIIWF